MPYFKIGNSILNQNSKPFFVAEIGINFEGSLEIAKKTILAAKRAGAHSVKFQYYKTEDFISNKKLILDFNKNNKKKKITQYELFKKNELSYKQIVILKEFSDKNDIIFHATPTSERTINELIDIGCKIIKNGSDFLTNFKILKVLAAKKIPLILSTGMCREKEINFALNFLKNYRKNNIILLHCVSNYPTKIQDSNISRISNLKNKYKLLCGYSDHTIGVTSAISARLLGSIWFEKHFTLDKKQDGPDHLFSCNEKDLKHYITSINEVDKCLGNGKIDYSKVEKTSRELYGISCFSKKNIPKNKKIDLHDITFLRPGDGIPPSKINKIIGKRALINIKERTKLKINFFKIY